jgi:hypothetical protein
MRLVMNPMLQGWLSDQLAKIELDSEDSFQYQDSDSAASRILGLIICPEGSSESWSLADCWPGFATKRYDGLQQFEILYILHSSIITSIDHCSQSSCEKAAVGWLEIEICSRRMQWARLLSHWVQASDPPGSNQTSTYSPTALQFLQQQKKSRFRKKCCIIIDVEESSKGIRRQQQQQH